jgi:hypothetical protein
LSKQYHILHNKGRHNKCGGVKPVKGIPTLLFLIIGSPTAIYGFYFAIVMLDLKLMSGVIIDGLLILGYIKDLT